MTTADIRDAGSMKDKVLSLYHLLDPEVLADPYPLYRRLRTEDPVHWDSFLHAWVVTRYPDVIRVLHHFSASRTPTPEQLSGMNLSALNPIAKVMVRQMLFLDPPDHTRLRTLASAAFIAKALSSVTDVTETRTVSAAGLRRSGIAPEVLGKFADTLSAYARRVRHY